MAIRRSRVRRAFRRHRRRRGLNRVSRGGIRL